MKAILRQVRISSKKAALVANLVRNKRAEDAVNILKFTTKKAAPLIRKVIQSAMANAANNFKQDSANLFVKEIVVTEGTTYKRGIHISRGRSHPILKRTAHISVSLESRPGSPKAAAKNVTDSTTKQGQSTTKNSTSSDKKDKSSSKKSTKESTKESTGDSSPTGKKSK